MHTLPCISVENDSCHSSKRGNEMSNNNMHANIKYIWTFFCWCCMLNGNACKFSCKSAFDRMNKFTMKAKTQVRKTESIRDHSNRHLGSIMCTTKFKTNVHPKVWWSSQISNEWNIEFLIVQRAQNIIASHAIHFFLTPQSYISILDFSSDSCLVLVYSISTGCFFKISTQADFEFKRFHVIWIDLVEECHLHSVNDDVDEYWGEWIADRSSANVQPNLLFKTSINAQNHTYIYDLNSG